MKKIAVPSIFLLLFLFVANKAIYRQNEQNEWNVKIMTDYDFNDFDRVIKAKDGYLAVGYASFYHIMAIKIDENGTLYGWNFCGTRKKWLYRKL